MPRKKKDPETAAALSVAGDPKAERAEQERREQLIAEVHQMVGRIQAMDVIGKFADVSNLVWLKQVKESKAYRDVPGIGTWDKFCKSVGLDTKTVDEDLRNLQTFGEQFLLTVSNLGLGYRDLRKLRQLSHEGEVVVEDDVIYIGGAEIPFDPEYKEDLLAAIEVVVGEKDAELQAQKRIAKSKEDLIKKLERSLRKFEKEAEAKGLSPEEDAFLQRTENHRIAFDGFMLQVDPARLQVPQEEMTPRMAASLISGLDYMRKQVRAAYDTAVEVYGAGLLEEDDEVWSPGMGK